MNLKINKVTFPILILSLIWLTSIYLYTNPVLAQSRGFTITPPGYANNIKPGEQVDTSFTLTNNTNAAVTGELSLGEFVPDNTNSYELTNTPDPQGSISWLKLDKTQISLDVNQTIEIPVSVIVPANAPEAAYFPVILVKFKTTDNSSPDETAGVNAILSFRLDLNITKEFPKSTISITKLTVSNPLLWGPATIDFTISNPLAQYVKPIVYLQVVNN